jgi:GntR family transcriptional regulator, transcriptional repressor for pyruvate dehydrogenase complex
MSDQFIATNDLEESPYLNPINRSLVVDEVIDRLIDLIVNENLKPGDKFPTERELMARLSVGRSSLREAVKTLTAVGALEVKRGSGIFVGSGDTSFITKPFAWGMFLNRISVDEVIEARSVIEIALAGWAAERGSDEDIASIGEFLDRLEKNKNDKEIYIDNDIKFHLAIAKAAKNKILFAVLTIFQHLLRIWMEITYQEEPGARDSMTLHRGLFEAIQAKDPEAARKIMYEHTSGVPLRSAVNQRYVESQTKSHFLFLFKNGNSQPENPSNLRR